MKRWIHAKEDPHVDTSLLQSQISDIRNNCFLSDDIGIDIDISGIIADVTASDEVDWFPGMDKFKSDVLDILENKYQFEVLEDDYCGVAEKGWISDRDNPTSPRFNPDAGAAIYFNTFYDLANARDVHSRRGITFNLPDLSATVYCFVHFRFAEHSHNDDGDIEHNNFLTTNMNKHINKKPNVDVVIREEDIYVKESLLNQRYRKALKELEDQLDAAIVKWTRMYKQRH